MLSIKKLNPFAKDLAEINTANSIANDVLDKPLFMPAQGNKQMIPTFDTTGARLFWFGFVIVSTLFGLGMRADYLTNWHDIWRSAVNLFTTLFFIVLMIIGYLQLAARRLIQLTPYQMLAHVALVVIVLTPIATVAAKTAEHFIVATPFFNYLFQSIVVNTLLSIITLLLLFYYARLQYQKIQAYERIYQQHLIEQNEHLKARITPHFFFNMLNTMQFLIETDTKQAEVMIKHISTLYRSSFSEMHEVALIDEIQLCQHYLSIEQYRFGDKLVVRWHLPDEDLLCDMVISSLTLQILLEKIIVLIVEMTTQNIYMDIMIEWVNDQVLIAITVNLPHTIGEKFLSRIPKQLSVNNQIDILRHYYGETANIDYSYSTHELVVSVHYPLKDVAF